MADFAHVLRRAEGRLRAPEPQRSRILLEIAQDLEGLHSELVARGMSPTDAAERAEAMLGASGPALDELDEVHLPAAARFLARFSSGRRHRVERGLLTTVTLCAIAAGAGGIFATGVATPISPVLWALPAVLALAVWCGASGLLDLYGRPARPLTRESLQPMLALSALGLALGFLGVLLEGWQLSTLAESAAIGPGPTVPYVRRAADLLALYLCESLLILLAWFHLRIRALEVEGARARARRLTHPPHHGETS